MLDHLYSDGFDYWSDAGCFTFRAAFFIGEGLGLALATVRFVAFALADLDALRALPRLAEFRFCTFDPFLRLAMVGPLVWFVCVTSYPQGMADQTTNRSLGNLSNEFSKRQWVPCPPCDADHRALDGLLLCCDCTVVPGGALQW